MHYPASLLQFQTLSKGMRTGIDKKLAKEMSTHLFNSFGNFFHLELETSHGVDFLVKRRQLVVESIHGRQFALPTRLFFVAPVKNKESDSD